MSGVATRKTVSEVRQGVVTVEMAIVAPLLIFLLFGIVEFGLMVRDSITVHEGAREGSASTSGAPSPSTSATSRRSIRLPT